MNGQDSHYAIIGRETLRALVLSGCIERISNIEPQQQAGRPARLGRDGMDFGNRTVARLISVRRRMV